MMWLASRLASADSKWSVALTVTGVGVGTALLLGVIAFPGAITEREERAAWRNGSQLTADADGDTHLRTWVEEIRTEALTRAQVFQEPDAELVMPGLDRRVDSGTWFASPALIDAFDNYPTDELRDRFPAGSPTGVIDPSSLAFPTELVAIEGVQAPGEGYDRVSTLPDTAPIELDLVTSIVASLAAVAVVVPVAVFIAASVRLSATRRERRLANVRLVGATKRDVRWLLIGETLLLTGAGVLVGIVLFWVLRLALGQIPSVQRSLLTASDLRPSALSVAVLLIGIPLVAVVAAMIGARRLDLSPLGVARRELPPPPSPWRFIPLGAGTALFIVVVTAFDLDSAAIYVLMAAFALMLLGFIFAGAHLTAASGRFLARHGRKATAVLAGRRLEHDPKAGFRAVVGAVLALFSASFLYTLLGEATFSAESGLRPAAAVVRVEQGVVSPETMAELSGLEGVSEAVGVEAVAGTPAWLGDCARAEMMLEGVCGDGGMVNGEGFEPGELMVASDGRQFQVPTAAGDPGPFGIYSPSVLLSGQPQHINRVLVATDGSAQTLDRIRTAISADDLVAEVVSRESFVAAEQSGNSTFARIVDLALFATLIVAGVSLAVTVAGSVVERRTPFSLLRMSGMRVAELRRVVMVEAGVPLASSAILGAAFGYGAAAFLVGRFTGEFPLPAPATVGRLILGTAVAMATTLVVLPVLGRVTATEQTRFS